MTGRGVSSFVKTGHFEGCGGDAGRRLETAEPPAGVRAAPFPQPFLAGAKEENRQYTKRKRNAAFRPSAGKRQGGRRRAVFFCRPGINFREAGNTFPEKRYGREGKEAGSPRKKRKPTGKNQVNEFLFYKMNIYSINGGIKAGSEKKKPRKSTVFPVCQVVTKS